MMMKLAYERPIMRAEAFATNAYCGACESQPKWSDCLKVVFGNITALFSSVKIPMLNPNTGDQQYYYQECTDHEDTNDGIFYLEFSQDQTNWNGGKPTFFLYKENEKSGYGASDLNGGSWAWPEPSDQATVTSSGTGLQVNSGSNGWSHAFGDRWDASKWWYSDDCLGNVSFTKGVVSLTVSG